MEIGSQSTNYKDYGSEKIYLNESRLSCYPFEIGCELYTPVDGNVGIPAVARIAINVRANAWVMKHTMKFRPT